MAFVQTAEWQLADRPRCTALAAPRIYQPVPQALRHLLAILGSALIHVLLIYFFLGKMLGSGGEADRPGTKSESLLLFDLSDATASEPERSQSATQQKQEQAREEVPAPAPVSPPEWKVAPLPKGIAPRPIAFPPPAAGSSVAVMPGSVPGSAGTSGGGDNYDPYAGAAPQRLMPQFQSGLQSAPGVMFPPPISSRDPLELDPEILNRLRRLASKDDGNRNDLVLTMEIDRDGSIKKITLTGGSPSLLKSIRKLLARAPLYRVAAPLTKVEIRQIKLS